MEIQALSQNKQLPESLRAEIKSQIRSIKGKLLGVHKTPSQPAPTPTPVPTPAPIQSEPKKSESKPKKSESKKPEPKKPESKPESKKPKKRLLKNMGH